MELTYAEIEHLLARQHQVHDDKRVALLGRVKHFQRLGWPPGTNSGKGSRVRYDVRRTLGLVVAFELLQSGLPPERVVVLLRQVESLIQVGFLSSLALDGRSEGPETDEDFTSNELANPGDHIFFVFEVQALKALSLPSGAELPDQVNFAGCWSSKTLPLFLNSLSWKYGPRQSVLDLTVLLDEVLYLISLDREIDRTSFRNEVRKWRDQLREGANGHD